MGRRRCAQDPAFTTGPAQPHPVAPFWLATPQPCCVHHFTTQVPLASLFKNPSGMNVAAVALTRSAPLVTRSRAALSAYTARQNLSMQASNRLKSAFAEGRQSMGVWQQLPGANLSRLLASSGADWVMVDCEHGNIDGR